MKQIRTYVKVTSDFDNTGYMQPRAITWGDGRVFRIDSVKDFRPASCLSRDMPGDCYTILIRGEERLLYFERANSRFPGRFGRWFVENPLKAE